MTKKKVFTCLLIIFFFAAIMLSVDFIIVKAEHDCCGEGCRVCAVLQVADDICGGDNKAEASLCRTAATFVETEFIPVGEGLSSVVADSPVSRCDILTI